MENTEENAKKFIDRLKEKGQYELSYDSVAWILWLYGTELCHSITLKPE